MLLYLEIATCESNMVALRIQLKHIQKRLEVLDQNPIAHSIYGELSDDYYKKHKGLMLLQEHYLERLVSDGEEYMKKRLEYETLYRVR